MAENVQYGTCMLAVADAVYGLFVAVQQKKGDYVFEGDDDYFDDGEDDEEERRGRGRFCWSIIAGLRSCSASTHIEEFPGLLLHHSSCSVDGQGLVSKPWRIRLSFAIAPKVSGYTLLYITVASLALTMPSRSQQPGLQLRAVLIAILFRGLYSRS